MLRTGPAGRGVAHPPAQAGQQQNRAPCSVGMLAGPAACFSANFPAVTSDQAPCLGKSVATRSPVLLQKIILLLRATIILNTGCEQGWIQCPSPPGLWDRRCLGSAAWLRNQVLCCPLLTGAECKCGREGKTNCSGGNPMTSPAVSGNICQVAEAISCVTAHLRGTAHLRCLANADLDGVVPAMPPVPGGASGTPPEGTRQAGHKPDGIYRSKYPLIPVGSQYNMGSAWDECACVRRPGSLADH